MTKKRYNEAKNISFNIELPKREKDLLAGKKVMLPLSKECNNRLSHSQDVEYVAEKIYRHLISNNNDMFVNSLSLTKIKTIALWHDVGHCPYGHSGEEKLNSLISENKGFYLDSFYSGYKHNLLSAKILLDLKTNVSWDIIDAVIKHSSVLPKNFNLSRANHNNILKLNYIFNCDRTNVIEISDKKIAVNNSWYFFMRDFISNFACGTCKIPKYNFINNNDCEIIKICENFTDNRGKAKNICRYCVTNKSNKNIKNNITKYLLFPYPLTLNGDIIRIADEISSLVRDIEYYSKFLKANQKNKYYIIEEKILDILNILKSKFIGQGKDFELIEKTKKLIKSEITGDDLIDYLIKKLKYNSQSFEIIEKNKYNDIPLVLNWNNKDQKNYCIPLLNFEDDISVLFEAIKKAIYGIIHKDKIIKDNNTEGDNYINKIFDFYYNNPNEFLKINDHLNDELNVITNTIKSMSCKTLVDKITYAKSHINDNIDYMKLLNSFRREIAFYIARLTETELKEFCETI